MSKPFVAIVMGSDSDLPVMEASVAVLHALQMPSLVDAKLAQARSDERAANAQEIHAKDAALQQTLKG